MGRRGCFWKRTLDVEKKKPNKKHRPSHKKIWCCWDNKGSDLITSSVLTTSLGNEKLPRLKSHPTTTTHTRTLFLTGFCTKQPLCHPVHHPLFVDCLLLAGAPARRDAAAAHGLKCRCFAVRVSQPPLKPERNRVRPWETAAPHWLDGSAHAMTTGYTGAMGWSQSLSCFSSALCVDKCELSAWKPVITITITTTAPTKIMESGFTELFVCWIMFKYRIRMFFSELKLLLLMRSGSSRTDTDTVSHSRMRGLAVGDCGWPSLSCSRRDDEEEYYGTDPRPRSLAFETDEDRFKPKGGNLDASSLPSLSDSGMRSPQCRICFQGPEKVHSYSTRWNQSRAWGSSGPLNWTRFTFSPV